MMYVNMLVNALTVVCSVGERYLAEMLTPFVYCAITTLTRTNSYIFQDNCILPFMIIYAIYANRLVSLYFDIRYNEMLLITIFSQHHDY